MRRKPLSVELLEEDCLLHTSQAARVLGVRPSTLRWWRNWSGDGPPFIKLSGAKGAVRYAPESLKRFIEERTVRPSTRGKK